MDIDLKEIQYIEDNILAKPIECAKILKKINVEELSIVDKAYYYKHIGIGAINNGDYFTAYKNWQKSLQIANENKIIALIDAGNLNLSAIYYYTQQYKKAIHHAFIASRSKSQKIQAFAYQNLALNYELTEDHDNALRYNNKSIKISEVLNKPDACLAALINNGNIMIQLGNNRKALSYFNKALLVTKKAKRQSSLSDAYVYLASYYDQIHDFKNGIKNAKLALKFANKFEIKRNYPQIYIVLINCNFQLDKLVKAKEYLDEYNNLEILDGDEQSIIGIYNLQIKIEQLLNGDSGALKVTNEKIEFLERKEALSKKQFELFRLFKEDENEKIEEAYKKLTQSNNELLNIAKILAHDIKTPVRTLGSFSNLLKEELDGIQNSKANEYLDFITQASKKLYSKLDYALELALIELKHPLRSINLNEVVSKVKRQHNGLKVIVSKSLPNFNSNYKLIFILFDNLFKNALDYSSKKNPKVTITSNIKNEHIVLTFSDNGIGISKDHTAKVFDIFYSSDQENKNGVGLSYCKKICELHDGTIKVESEIGKGTDVIIEWPLTEKLI